MFANGTQSACTRARGLPCAAERSREQLLVLSLADREWSVDTAGRMVFDVRLGRTGPTKGPLLCLPEPLRNCSGIEPVALYVPKDAQHQWLHAPFLVLQSDIPSDDQLLSSNAAISGNNVLLVETVPRMSGFVGKNDGDGVAVLYNEQYRRFDNMQRTVLRTGDPRRVMSRFRLTVTLPDGTSEPPRTWPSGSVVMTLTDPAGPPHLRAIYSNKHTIGGIANQLVDFEVYLGRLNPGGIDNSEYVTASTVQTGDNCVLTGGILRPNKGDTLFSKKLSDGSLKLHGTRASDGTYYLSLIQDRSASTATYAAKDDSLALLSGCAAQLTTKSGATFSARLSCSPLTTGVKLTDGSTVHFWQVAAAVVFDGTPPSDSDWLWNKSDNQVTVVIAPGNSMIPSLTEAITNSTSHNDVPAYVLNTPGLRIRSKNDQPDRAHPYLLIEAKSDETLSELYLHFPLSFVTAQATYLLSSAPPLGYFTGFGIRKSVPQARIVLKAHVNVAKAPYY